MSELVNDTVYCSIDLELSGFDPLKDEILEVGFVFFIIKKSGVKILEEWSQIFKPTKPVHPKILGLTGLNETELENAPTFADFHEFLNEKLSEVILVGHGLSLDVKFLEAFGVRLSGNYIDTLDLVQFILPTYHSYNLENLMYSFAVPHPKAHRALADSHATIIVLEKLLRLYQSFPHALKKQIEILIKNISLPWLPLFQVPLNPEPAKVSPLPAMELENTHLELADKTILNLPINIRQPDWLAGLVKSWQGPILLAVSSDSSTLRLWKQYGIEAIFLPRHMFDPGKFESFLTLTRHTQDEIKFILKILVWRATNWQTKTILDLNLSFFGGQFRSLITASDLQDFKIGEKSVCSYDTLPALSQQQKTASASILVDDFLEFHHRFEAAGGNKLSWGYLTNLLRAVYDPVTGVGNTKLKEPVLNLLTAADLFFGLVMLNLQKYFAGLPTITLAELKENSYPYSQLQKAAGNFVKKLLAANEKIQSSELADYATALEKFLETETDRVKWIEIRGVNCRFYDLPLDIAPIVKGVLNPYQKIIFSNLWPEQSSLSYLEDRLGLNDFKIESISDASATNGLRLKLSKENDLEPDILKYLTKEHLPTVVVFRNIAEVKDFYNTNYANIKTYANIFAQGYSGGGNKMFRNFGIKPNSILLVTEDFLFNNRFHQLYIKTIWFKHWFASNDRHPYSKALYDHWHKKYPDFNLLQQLLRFFSSMKMILPVHDTTIYLELSELDINQQEALENSLKKTKVFNIL